VKEELMVGFKEFLIHLVVLIREVLEVVLLVFVLIQEGGDVLHVVLVEEVEKVLEIGFAVVENWVFGADDLEDVRQEVQPRLLLDVLGLSP
jgi:hypothetical protein